VYEAPNPAPTATLRDHHATPPPSRTMSAMRSRVPPHPAPHMVQSVPGPLGPFSPPEGMGSRRRGARAFPMCHAREGGRPHGPPRSQPFQSSPPRAITNRLIYSRGPSLLAGAPPSARDPTHPPEEGRAGEAEGDSSGRIRMCAAKVPSPAAEAPACNAEEGRK